MLSPTWFRRTGFTLVELLVVVAIIGVLVALLLPAMQSAREAARRSACANNLKQLATACKSHVTLLSHYPTGGWDSSTTGSPDLGSDWRQQGGWCYTLLPFMDQTNLYNNTVAAVRNTIPVPMFACPTRRGSSIGPGGVVMTDYAGNRGTWASLPSSPTATSTDRDTTFGLPSGAGSLPLDATNVVAAANLLNTVQAMFATGSAATGGIIFVGSALPPARIRDGASNTYLFAEKYVPQAAYVSGTTGYSVAAYAGDSPDTLRGGHRLPESDATVWADTRKGAFGGPHVGVFNAAFCDGSMRVMDLDIARQTHFLLSSREDRQAVSQ
jgi:prepilin-type N-terminal cleavage/methylation domain-containing protein